MKKLIIILALLPTLVNAQDKPKINLNLELIKEGNKLKNEAIFTAIIGSTFAYWGTKRKNGKAMVFIGITTASLSIPMTIIGDRKVKKGIIKFK